MMTAVERLWRKRTGRLCNYDYVYLVHDLSCSQFEDGGEFCHHFWFFVLLMFFPESRYVRAVALFMRDSHDCNISAEMLTSQKYSMQMKPKMTQKELVDDVR